MSEDKIPSYVEVDPATPMNAEQVEHLIAAVQIMAGGFDYAGLVKWLAVYDSAEAALTSADTYKSGAFT